MTSPEFVEHFNDAHTSYNMLPSLYEADILFNDRDKVFRDLIAQNVYAKHDKFVVTLIHRHFILEPGEKMVTRGDVTQPEKDAKNVYPSAWLANGKPFEFSDQPVPEHLSAYISDLLQPLRKLPDTAQFEGIPILGIRYVPTGLEENMIDVEVTHSGRRSITRRIPVDDVLDGKTVTSCWFLDYGKACEKCKCEEILVPHLRVCTPDINLRK